MGRGQNRTQPKGIPASPGLISRPRKNQIHKEFKVSRKIYNHVDPDKGKVIILCGVPGSGKSTYTGDLLKANPDIVVVSSDAIRKELFASLREANAADPSLSEEERKERAKKANGKVFFLFNARIKKALEENKQVIADATNLTGAARKNMRELAAETNSASELVVFNNIELALKQNKQRDLDAIVPDEAMERMLNQYASTKKNLLENPNEKYDIITSVDVES